MAIFMNGVLFSALFGHFTVDLLNGQRSVLFTYLSEPMGLSITQLALFSTLYIAVAAVMQPVFGYVTDRVGPRWLISGGIAWMGAFFAAGILVPGYAGVLLLVTASLGSGAFHPAGTMQATLVGRKLFKGRETTSAAYFFLFGQMGLFLGPLLSGLLLGSVGQKGLLWLCALAIPAAIYSGFFSKRLEVNEDEPEEQVVEEDAPTKRVNGWVLAPLALLATFQSWSQQNMVTFIPKHLDLLGKTPVEYGLMASLFMGGSAVGNVLGGNLADRYGKRRVAGAALALATVPVGLIAVVGWSPWLYALIPLAGLFTGATHSIIVVLAQRLIPTGMGFASGLILGFMFLMGALGSLLSGAAADLWGFPVMFGLTVLLVAAGAGLTATLPKS